MYKQLIIITDLPINYNTLKDFDYLIIPNCEIVSTYKIKYEENTIEFDYIIVTSKINKNLLSEDGFIITNQNYETNIDNYFAIGKAIRSDKSFNDQLNTVIEYLKGNN